MTIHTRKLIVADRWEGLDALRAADADGRETKDGRSTADKINDAVNNIAERQTKFISDHEKAQAALQERIEELEARGSGSKAASARTTGERIDIEHKAKFCEWLRKPQDGQVKVELENIQTKALNIATGADGGFAVPKELVQDIERLMEKLSPVRRLVKVMRASSSDFNHLVSLGNAEAGWSSESGTRSETDTPQLRNVKPTHGEIYAYPKASNWSLADMFFDVQAWLTEEVAQAFVKLEGEAVISGDGTNKPTGMLNTTPVLTADGASPLRAAAAYQYLVSDADADGSPAAVGIRADSLIDLVYELNSAYRSGAAWVMNSTTTAAVRKLKDAEGRFIWADSLASGQPAQLLGYPVETWENLPSIGDGNFPLAFGNFGRGYLLADLSELLVTVDPYTEPGQTKFYVRRRVGGMPLNNDAIKWLRTVE